MDENQLLVCKLVIVFCYIGLIKYCLVFIERKGNRRGGIDLDESSSGNGTVSETESDDVSTNNNSGENANFVVVEHFGNGTTRTSDTTKLKNQSQAKKDSAYIMNATQGELGGFTRQLNRGIDSVTIKTKKDRYGNRN